MNIGIIIIGVVFMAIGWLVSRRLKSKFAQYSKDESVFYAVGGAHLGGEQGVIKLLKKAGYTVTPVLE